MKAAPRKLTINRETLRDLDRRRMAAVKGAAITQPKTVIGCYSMLEYISCQPCLSPS